MFPFSPVDYCQSGILFPFFLSFFFCSSSKRRLTSPLRRAAPFVGDKCFDFFLLPLGETTFKDERPDIFSGSALLPRASHQQPRRTTTATVTSCFAPCPIYLFIHPPPAAPACRSLLILPIKINFRLKIPTLAHQRGRNQGGGGLARSAARSLTSVFLKKVSLVSTSEPGRIKQQTLC